MEKCDVVGILDSSGGRGEISCSGEISWKGDQYGGHRQEVKSTCAKRVGKKRL